MRTMPAAAAAVATLLLAACGDDGGGGPGAPRPSPAPAAHVGAELAGELAIARGGCVRCHAAPVALAERLAPVTGRSLAMAARWAPVADRELFLRGHHGGEAAADLAAWLAARAGEPWQESEVVSAAMQARGEQVIAEQACGGCHAPNWLAQLTSRTDYAPLTAFLADPAAEWPGLAHLALSADDAAAVATWLLRDRLDVPSAAPQGFGCDCYQLTIDDAELPDLIGRVPVATTVRDQIDANATELHRNFVLDFHADLDVPAAGEWTFTVGSDDGSWLWIDGRLVVENGQIAPLRRRSGKVTLTAGVHALRVLFTQAAGEQILEASWQGPGVEREAIPAARARAVVRRIAPRASRPAPDGVAVARGSDAAVARGCVACHADGTAQPARPAAKPLLQLGEGACPQVPGAAGILAAARPSFASSGAPADLALALRRNGCRGCHVRDGEGGLPEAVRGGLTVTEDLGDEGRMPPDLTAVGHRLRPLWVERFLQGDVAARPYMRLAHPRLPAERARQFAAWFAAVDGRPGDDDEPPFSAEAAALGRTLAGTTGRNCITCHPFAGHRALGPQGMDLGLQFERLRPAWFGEWVLAPNVHRPATRMVAMWPPGDPNGPREVAALRTWLSLGAAAPLPDGVPAGGRGLVLEPRERPILHGAFLKGLSARCLAVGSPLRTHWAFDIEHARLAWLWRGDFVDAAGTWSGRAGELVEPAGQDWCVLDDVAVTAGDGTSQRRVLGQRRTADGYPVLRVAVGDAEYEDEVRARLADGGSEVVRTLRCVRGQVTFAWPAAVAPLQITVDGKPAAAHTLAAAQHVEVVYRW